MNVFMEGVWCVERGSGNEVLRQCWNSVLCKELEGVSYLERHERVRCREKVFVRYLGRWWE